MIDDGFKVFLSVEDFPAAGTLSDETNQLLERCKELRASMEDMTITESKYTKRIRGVSVDVYDVLAAWGVANPALQHLIKKALQCGQRGHKDKQQDLQDIIDSAIRAKELES